MWPAPSPAEPVGKASAMTTIAILADTHMPKGRRELPPRCVEICRASDLIIHAGDLIGESVLDLLESFGPPVVAVHGNVDSEALMARLPETRVVEAGPVRLGVIHDAGPKRGRLERMAKRFPGCDAAIFGHSHLPLEEKADGFRIFNPGSPTERRRSPFRSMGRATVERGAVRFELIDLGS